MAAVAGAKALVVWLHPYLRNLLYPAVFQSFGAGLPPHGNRCQLGSQVIHMPSQRLVDSKVPCDACLQPAAAVRAADVQVEAEFKRHRAESTNFDFARAKGLK